MEVGVEALPFGDVRLVVLAIFGQRTRGHLAQGQKLVALRPEGGEQVVESRQLGWTENVNVLHLGRHGVKLGKASGQRIDETTGFGADLVRVIVPQRGLSCPRALLHGLFFGGRLAFPNPVGIRPRPRAGVYPHLGTGPRQTGLECFIVKASDTVWSPKSMANEPELVVRNRRLAEAGDPEAQFNLGNMYRIGYQVAADTATSVYWLTAAARNGHAEAIEMLEDMGIDWRQPAPVLDPQATVSSPDVDPDSLFADPPARDPQAMRQAAEAGDAEAQVALGNAYRFGEGVARDLEEAVRWYRRAADQGAAIGQYALAAMFDLGLGVAEDLDAARDLYARAARQGNSGAQFNLGNMTLAGRGGERDPVEAVAWFEKAAAQGDAAAHFALGALYERGTGLPKDDGQAIRHYRDAAERGDADAQFNLANMVREGRGTTADQFEAAMLYRRAGEQGLAAAQLNYALMLATGQSGHRNDRMAVEWLRRAADQGDPRAQYYLATFHEQGRGVARDPVEAAHWYRRAALAGDARAQYDLAALLATGDSLAQDLIEAFAWFGLAAVATDPEVASAAVEGLKAIGAALGGDDIVEAERRRELYRGGR